MDGRFISFEGGEGVGKSTQLGLLASALRARDIAVVETREPGGSVGGEMIRSLLLKGSQERWNARSEALLFAAARADHVEQLICPALAEGKWVLCDRFIDSSRAYQGGGGGLDDSDILALHRFGSQGIVPDRTFLLALSPEIASERLRKRDGMNTDRIGSKSADYHRRVASSFATIAEREPERWRLIAAQGNSASVSAAILRALADILP